MVTGVCRDASVRVAPSARKWRRSTGLGSILGAGLALAATILPELRVAAEGVRTESAPILQGAAFVPLADRIASFQLAEVPKLRQRAQLPTLRTGEFANPDTGKRARELSQNIDFWYATGCSNLANLDRNLQLLADLAAALPPFVQGGMRPAGARTDGVYQDGLVRGHDGDLVRAELGKAQAKRDELASRCRPPAPRTPPPAAAPPPSGNLRTAAVPPGAPRNSIDPIALIYGGGPVFEPWIAGAIRRNDADGSYSSDGGQPSGSGTGNRTQANFCGGVDTVLPLGGPLSSFLNFLDEEGATAIWFGSTQIGARFGVCELGNGDKVVFKEARHPGADGTVTLTERERTEVTMMLLVRQLMFIDFSGLFGSRVAGRDEQYASTELAQAGFGRPRNYWPFMLYGGVGPSLVRTSIEIASDQTGAGGRLESASQRRWDLGLTFMVGAQTALCKACLFGNPVLIGVEGQWTRLPKRDIAVTSAAFGFTESGRVSNRNSSRVMFRLTVPLAP